MSVLNKFMTGATAIFLLVGLSGCASMMRTGEKARAQCIHSPVLYTNLQQMPARRVYQLENGQDCTTYYQVGDQS